MADVNAKNSSVLCEFAALGWGGGGGMTVMGMINYLCN